MNTTTKNSIFAGLASHLNASYYVAIAVLIVAAADTLLYSVKGLASDGLPTAAKYMTPITALGVVLSASSMLVLRKAILNSADKLPRLKSTSTMIALLFAGAITSIGILEIHSEIMGLNFSWDTILLGRPNEIFGSSQPRSPSSAITSSMMMLAGLAFFTLTLAPNWPWIWQVFPMIGIIISALFCYSFLFEVPLSRGDIHFSRVPLSTCLAFLLIYIGQLFLRPDIGIFKPFNSEHLGGQILRSRGPLMAGFFILLATLAHFGFRLGFYDSGFGFAMFITLSTASFFFTFYSLAISFNIAHEKLQASQRFSNRILEVCPGIITIYQTADNRYIFGSNQLSKVLGYSIEEVTGRKDVLTDLVHQDDLQGLLAERKKILYLPDDGVHTYSFRWRHKDGSWRTLLTTATPYKRDKDGHPIEILACSSDITDLVQLQKSLQQKNQELQLERQKLLRSNRDLEIFASVAAHDLKSPLQSMTSWISVLGDSASEEQRQTDIFRSALNFVERNAKKSISLVNDLLNISRLNSETSAPQNCDMMNVVNYVLQILTDDLEKSQAKITVGKLPAAPGIPIQYETLFSNLLRNAINYRRKDRQLEIEIGAAHTPDGIEYFVRDNGMGIPAELHESIFDLFKRAHGDDDHPGNGLGLAYCRKVVELRGGRIWVESEINVGSTFKFLIPSQTFSDV